jgi:hypothetical protein
MAHGAYDIYGIDETTIRIKIRQIITMCVICEDQIEPGQKILDCHGCPRITDIPMIPGLEELDCSQCVSLIHLFVYPGLLKLDCSLCTSLLEISTVGPLDQIDMVSLDTNGCDSLIHIPLIPGLQILDCGKCKSLTCLPQIPGLRSLFCWDCVSLIEIPLIPGLEELYCDRCESLTSLPQIPGSETFIYSVGCKWLNINNPCFEENVKKLIKIQRWARKILLSLRLTNLIPKLMPIYYHPDSKGGYFHKKQMLSFIQGIER